jgi:hypothetical protein
MAVLPDSDSNKPGIGNNEGTDIFREHLWHMRSFMRSHQGMLVIRLVPVHRMVRYDVRHLRETGGNMFHFDHTDWPILLPLREVTRHYISMN